MPLENGHDGKEKQYPDQLRHEIEEEKGADKVAPSDPEAGGHPVTPQETTAIKEVITPAPTSPEEQEELYKSYYAEASLTKKITVFALTTVFILIAIGLIYAYWPLGTPR